MKTLHIFILIFGINTIAQAQTAIKNDSTSNKGDSLSILDSSYKSVLIKSNSPKYQPSHQVSLSYFDDYYYKSYPMTKYLRYYQPTSTPLIYQFQNPLPYDLQNQNVDVLKKRKIKK